MATCRAFFICLAVPLSALFLHLIHASAGSDWHRWQEKPNPPAQNWINHGGDIHNRRYASAETKISASTASQLRLRWKFYAGKDISATPAIFDGTIYFPSWNGYLYAVRACDGSLVWKKNLRELTKITDKPIIANVNTTVSRTTPTVAGGLLILGITGPAVVIAVKRSSGNLVWLTRLDDHPAGMISMSGTFYNGAFYVGTSSQEEGFSSIEKCCTFRGSFAKLDARTGSVQWQTFMLPDNHGATGEYAGAAVWGSSPSIDVHRNLVYIATGNLYSAPLRVRRCQEELNNQTSPTHPDRCVEPENHSDSILALDLDSGKLQWTRQLGGYDVWFFACLNISTPNCPPGPNPDADFAEAPMMLRIKVNSRIIDVVVAVQKSGFAWALDRDYGNIIWATEAGPGGFGGGAMWGAATDGKRVYTNIANSLRLNFTLVPYNKTTTAGGWVAMDANDGRILWSVADPANTTVFGPVTVANGVIFAGSSYREGPVYALNARTGKVLWSYNTGATVYGGASVSDGCVYIGSGYKVSFLAANPAFTPGNSLFAFCLD
ncbi:Polyvinyl alcohol dehydrogenase (cytochrome) [Bertholletia excelsa]